MTRANDTARILAGGVVFNEDSADVDFRVESDTNTHALFVQGSDGRIGISTSSPDTESLIDLGSGENSGHTRKFNIVSTGNSRAGFGALSNLFRMYYADDQSIQIGTVSRDGAFTFSEKMRINSAGVVSIGNTDTNAKITVSQDGSALNIMRLQNTNGSHSCTYIQFANSGNNSTGNIVQTGSGSVVYNTSSDYRLKENVSYNFDATTRLKQLKPARFNFILDGTDKVVDGFLAHEVQTVVPEAITGTKDAMTAEVLYVDGDDIPDGKEVGDVKTASQIDPQGIDQSKLVPLLVKTIQELEARITALESV